VVISDVRNAASTKRPSLDFTGCKATPWQGAGSQKAVVVMRGEDAWRVKATADGRSSAMEVTSGKLFQLTGLLAPDTELVEPLAGLPTSGDGVGSRYDPGFQDLGDFLASDAAVAAVAEATPSSRRSYVALQAQHAGAITANATLLHHAGVEWWALGEADAALHAANDRLRFDALEAMNGMLPEAMRCEQLRHYIASRWLDNWDHLNYRLENFGYTERDGQHVGMSLDFGSCGPLGFRSLHTGQMLPKQLSGEVAILQRPGSLFPIPPAFTDGVARFDALNDDPGALHDTTRWPYGFQSESIAAMFRPPVAPTPGVADTLAEMGYRLSLLPAAAIATVLERHWPAPADADASAWPDAATMTQRMVARRDAMLARFDPAQMSAWMQADPARAGRVCREVSDALQAVLGSGTDTVEDVRRTYAALLQAAPTAQPASAPAAAINGACPEIQCLQALHDALEQLDRAWEDGRPSLIRAAAAALVAPVVHEPMQRMLRRGPGRAPRTLEAFLANHAWLMVMDRLVDAGQLPAADVAALLLTPTPEAAYPPNVAAWSERHPQLGIAFIQLMDTLIAHGVPARQLRTELLTAKHPGTPGYYAEVLRNSASRGWVERLQHSGLWPDADDLQVKSLRSRAAFAARSHLPGGRASIAQPRLAHEQQHMALKPLVATLRQAYAPERLVALELDWLRQEAIASVGLIHRDERDALSRQVTQAVETAWAQALKKHGLPRDPVPAELMEAQQREAGNRYERDMWALRQDDAERLIARAGQVYRDAVLADPALSAEARHTLFTAAVHTAVTAVQAMVSDAARAGPPEVDVPALGDQVRRRAQALTMAQRTVQREAGKRAERGASAEAARRTDDEVKRAARAAADQLQRSAALLAFQKTTEQARASTRARVTQEAEARAARVGEAKTERIAQRLTSLKNFRQGLEMDNEISARLARLRTPVQQASAVRGAQFLDDKGQPRVAYR